MSLRATLLEKLLFTVGPSFPTRKSITGENAISIRNVGKPYLTSAKAALFDIRKSTRARDCINVMQDRIYVRDRSYKRDECGSVFHGITSIIQHWRNHTKEKLTV
eukprot:bmy_11232T0